MTSNQFKQKYPEYAHLEGETLWNTMEEVLSGRGETWVADYSQGYVVQGTVTHTNGCEMEIRDPKFWINAMTGDRITNEEKLSKEQERKSNPVESFGIAILDFSKKSF